MLECIKAKDIEKGILRLDFGRSRFFMTDLEKRCISWEKVSEQVMKIDIYMCQS